MIRLINKNLYLVLAALLLTVSTMVSAAEVGPDDLRGEDRDLFDRYRYLMLNGKPDDFYAYAAMYEKHLKDKGYMMLYYKLLNNEGFYALRHNMIFRAMQAAERLDGELRSDGASDYFYLATGLMGDVYFTTHDRAKAEKFFVQALEEVGDRDPKFTMRTYQSLAEMLSLKDPQSALAWMEKSVELAQQTENTEYYSLSLAMTAYIHFLSGNSEAFYQNYDQYQNLLSMEKPGFNHRYDKVMEIAKLAFDGDYRGAIEVLSDKETVYVDSALVAIRVYSMERNIEQGFEAMKRSYLDMDSIYSLTQSANFDQMATERTLMRSREEAEANRKLARSLTNWLIGLIVVFLVVYIMGRRRLMLKIWERNRDLNVALAKAEESDRMKTAFIRSMSHEIRTPLNAVAGFSELICSPEVELSDDEKLDMKERIANNVHQITTIINEVLELSKSESESVISDEDKSDVWCNEIGRSVLHDVKGQQNVGVELRFSSNVKDDFTIRTNTYRLKHALAYLVDNALKFTDKGHVEVRCEKQGDVMTFSVTDTGVGVKEEDHERIFETFAKVDDFKEGVGLGLPICRRLVRSLRGDVKLDPSYADGSRFVITVPLK